jgi:hypothetical protein
VERFIGRVALDSEAKFYEAACAPQHEQVLRVSDYASSSFDAAHNKKTIY